MAGTDRTPTEPDALAAAGIPAPPPCPYWCVYTGRHSTTILYDCAMIVHGTGPLDTDGPDESVSVAMTWCQEYDEGEWRPIDRANTDVHVHIRTGPTTVEGSSAPGFEENLTARGRLAELTGSEVFDRIATRIAEIAQMLTATVKDPQDQPDTGPGSGSAG